MNQYVCRPIDAVGEEKKQGRLARKVSPVKPCTASVKPAIRDRVLAVVGLAGNSVARRGVVSQFQTCGIPALLAIPIVGRVPEVDDAGLGRQRHRRNVERGLTGDGIQKQNAAITNLVAQRDDFVQKYNHEIQERNDVVAKYNDLAKQMQKLQSGGSSNDSK